jgi:predicted YcjX-like family ATPase
MIAQTADHADVVDQKQAALRLMLDAFAEADLDGIDPDCIAQAALFAALKEFVAAYGEEPVAAFAERLPDRVRNGEFTVHRHG